MCNMQGDSTCACMYATLYDIHVHTYQIAILISQYAYKFGHKGNPFDFYTGWPKKNETILICYFNDILDWISLIFVALDRIFFSK